MRLERLLIDHSFADRRSPELLAEITRLLEDAVREGALALGSTPAEVRHTIGPPSLARGDESDETFDWCYPRTAPGGAAGGEAWYRVLRFRGGRLGSISDRIWREGR